MDITLSVRSAIQLSNRLDKLRQLRQEVKDHLSQAAAQLQQQYEERLEERTDNFMNGLEDAYDDFMRERKLRLAQLKGSADFFEPFTKYGGCLNIGKYHESQFCQLFGSFQGFHRIG